ncbi:unnamed protein product [Acanthoscelides obtectus]|uniref:DDE Tnp4 domain-containing protein n=1 Tax=Acanthoscelides obtectus TaxID=200917 RepID=A0A9P0Q9R4_ACAOB|nr:unnamed protein product [Acanthoscelides obtectus]CAK1622949.1 hypothetical protein AOBTE_LOCUS1740 [Acanthoscelides obtectus]
MKGYPVEQKKGSKKRIFNYRLCRARRIVENVFGIMSAVFRVLRKVMLVSPEKATLVVLACIYLHNFLRKSKHSRNTYTPSGTFDDEKEGKIIPGQWRQGSENKNAESFLPIPKIGRKSSANCEAIRNEFATYFMGEGSGHSISEPEFIVLALKIFIPATLEEENFWLSDKIRTLIACKFIQNFIYR